MGMASERSLRSVVEKWLAPTSGTPVRVTRLGRPQAQGNCVHIELLSPARRVGLFFFRHRDGSWSVCPPQAERLAMRIH
nr:hypothetical protein [Paraburkholderia mimosarum]